MEQEPTVRPAHAGQVACQVIRRPFSGGILGAIGGALAGALVGALAGGRLGTLVGGSAGLVGGAILGDRKSTRRRSLSGPEIRYAQGIFRGSVEYGKVVITRDSLFSAGAPKTIGNTIHLKSTPPWNHFKEDTMELAEGGWETLIHEMGHVWQYRNGGLAYIPDSLWAQLRAWISSGSRNRAYDWEAAHRQRKPWEMWNPEQQAKAIETYSKLLRKCGSGQTGSAAFTVLETYMHEVWNCRGAPRFFPSAGQSAEVRTRDLPTAPCRR